MAALRKADCHVEIIGEPVDLLVQATRLGRSNAWQLLEVKPPEWKKWRKDQAKQEAFCKRFKVPVVQSEEEALRAVALI